MTRARAAAGARFSRRYAVPSCRDSSPRQDSSPSSFTRPSTTTIPSLHVLHAADDLYLRQLLDDRADRPAVAAGVLDARAAVAVELVLRLVDRRRAGLERAPVGRVDRV